MVRPLSVFFDLVTFGSTWRSSIPVRVFVFDLIWDHIAFGLVLAFFDKSFSWLFLNFLVNDLTWFLILLYCFLVSGSPAVLAFFDSECFFLIFSRVLVSTGKTRFPFDDSLIVFVGICLSSIFIIMPWNLHQFVTMSFSSSSNCTQSVLAMSSFNSV